MQKIDDSFQKIVIVGDDIATYSNEDGIIFMGLFQFLDNKGILFEKVRFFKKLISLQQKYSSEQIKIVFQRRLWQKL